MKRDILDDFADFLQSENSRAVIRLKPKMARVDEDGDIEHHMELILHFPGIGAVRGGAIVWFPEDFFPHLEYDTPCETVMHFSMLDPSSSDDAMIDCWLRGLDLSENNDDLSI